MKSKIKAFVCKLFARKSSVVASKPVLVATICHFSQHREHKYEVELI